MRIRAVHCCIGLLWLSTGCPGDEPHATVSVFDPMSTGDGEAQGTGSATSPALTSSGGETTGTETTDTTAAGTTDAPCKPATCTGVDCGSIDDGCGATLDCGGCGEGLSCASNTCTAPQFASAKKVWSTTQTTYPVRAVAWSSDGERLATAGCADFPTEGEYVVWNSQNGASIWGYQYPPSPTTRIAWSPDGTKVVLGTRNAWPQIYSATNGTKLGELTGCHDGEINGVDWRADGKQIASAGGTAANPGATPESCIWDAVTRQQLHKQTYNDTYAVNDIAFSFDGKSYAVVTDELFSIFNASNHAAGDYVDFQGSLEEPWTLDGVDWSPDNLRLLTWTYAEYFMIDLETGDVYGGASGDGITEGTWSPSGLKFALSLANGKVRVYDRLTGALDLQFSAHDVATSIDWSFHEQYLATGGEVPRLAVWKLEY